MAYRKINPQENTNQDNVSTAPGAPKFLPLSIPQAPSASGGAPKLPGTPTDIRPAAPPSAPYIPTPTGVAPANNALRQAWQMTGTPPGLFNNWVQRSAGASPASDVAQALSSIWNGQTADGANFHSPVPATMTLDQSQKYLGELVQSIKSTLDARVKTLGPEALTSRFWNAYRNMPNEMATLLARRVFTNQMVSTGPIADWMKWLGG